MLQTYRGQPFLKQFTDEELIPKTSEQYKIKFKHLPFSLQIVAVV